MSKGLFRFLLSLLDKIDSPLIEPWDIASYPALEVQELLNCGILREASRSEEIPRPERFGCGGDLVVKETDQGIFGVSREEDYSAPVLLSDADVRQYSISVPRLAAEFCRHNQIETVPFRLSEGLGLLGSRRIAGSGTVSIYISLPNDGQQAVFGRCMRTKRGSAGSSSVLVLPEEPVLSPDLRRLVEEAGVRLLGLGGVNRLRDLTVNWDDLTRSGETDLSRPVPYRFKRNDSMWEIVFNGCKQIQLRDSFGLRYILELIRAEGREVYCAELYSAVQGEEIGLGSAGEVLDDKAQASYRKRAREIELELEVAARNHDLATKQRLTDELERIADELARSKKFGGASKQDLDDKERVRKSVLEAIRRARRAMQRHNQGLAKHMSTHIATGYYLSYTGDIAWEV